MKSDYTTNSRYITHTIAFWKVGRIHFLRSGVKGLSSCFWAFYFLFPQSRWGSGGIRLNVPLHSVLTIEPSKTWKFTHFNKKGPRECRQRWRRIQVSWMVSSSPFPVPPLTSTWIVIFQSNLAISNSVYNSKSPLFWSQAESPWFDHLVLTRLFWNPAISNFFHVTWNFEVETFDCILLSYNPQRIPVHFWLLLFEYLVLPNIYKILCNKWIQIPDVDELFQIITLYIVHIDWSL